MKVCQIPLGENCLVVQVLKSFLSLCCTRVTNFWVFLPLFSSNGPLPAKGIIFLFAYRINNFREKATSAHFFTGSSLLNINWINIFLFLLFLWLPGILTQMIFFFIMPFLVLEEFWKQFYLAWNSWCRFELFVVNSTDFADVGKWFHGQCQRWIYH